MSKEETAPGLLSKMVKFVRNPATSWSDLDQAEADREDSVSKQLLKEMIERKRRNDFVRKREFDMLRKMRKREAMAGVGQDQAERPSFFQSSMPSRPDDRASTLKKIDEIEAQMSMQWWKTKNGTVHDASGRVQAPQGAAGAPAPAPVVQQASPLAYRKTEPAGLQSLAAARANPVPLRAAPSQPVPPPQEPFASPLAASAPSDPVAAAAVSPPGAAGVPLAAAEKPTSVFGSAASDFSSSKFFAVEAGAVFTHDTELEEAAIRFANGDDAGAEAGLLDILGPHGSRQDHAESWLTLFDLYRATAQQDKFETAAIQFVERFNRSAPQWFSMPDMVKKLSMSTVKTGNGPAAHWICPSVVGIQTVAAMKAALAKAPEPWCLDWSNLKTIEAAAVEPLYSVFTDWAGQPVKIRFMGDAKLQAVLQAATPSGVRETPQSYWQLRMQALRVTHRPDDFELAALDFCVTYEVSPPSWESARCRYRPLDPEGGTLGVETIIGDVYRDSSHSRAMSFDNDSRLDSQMSQMPQGGNLMAVELSGTIQGDAIAVLDKLAVKLNGADMMVISCAKLIRVDFSAAGTLLNWVSARQAENRAVQFSEVNRLVAAFFNVIGITEQASVIVHAD